MTAGAAVRLVPALGIASRRFCAGRSWSVFQRSWPMVLGLAATPVVTDQIKLSRERARPMPAPGSPNVLLIVLDTVAAGHLNLYGYDRPTSTTLVELAERGIRFDSARAASSWTLPSHATMFTGRWMHELSVGWLNPLDGRRPTLAEYLELARLRDGRLRRQYDVLCQRYRARPRLHSLRRFHLSRAHRTQDGRSGQSCPGASSASCCRSWRTGRRSRGCGPMCRRSGDRFVFDRKGAATVNREFLDWLSRRRAAGAARSSRS